MDLQVGIFRKVCEKLKPDMLIAIMGVIELLYLYDLYYAHIKTKIKDIFKRLITLLLRQSLITCFVTIEQL